MICQCTILNNGSHEMQPVLIISVLSPTNKLIANRLQLTKYHDSDFIWCLISETLKDQSLFAASLPFRS